MAERPLNDEPTQRLSALMDGECDAQAADQLCRAWRDDSGLRQTWHAWQLIGDVLRSEDLAHPADRDEAFLAALRRRMAGEPTVIAPSRAAEPALRESEPPTPRRAVRSRWAPVAAAAGVAAVAGVLVVTRMSSPGAAESSRDIAAAPAAPSGLTPVSASSPSPEAADPSTIVTDGKLIRDAQLDRYLAAHKQFGSAAVAVPGMVLRSSATVAPTR